MPSSSARRWRAAGLSTALLLVAGLAALAAQVVTPGRAVPKPRPHVAAAAPRGSPPPQRWRTSIALARLDLMRTRRP